ncbi:alpha/beta hydrolase [Burkholderia cepacia]|uniref:alpha/beta hydrolase n=1 Tax=Burkholderia cepacia TaxID=292 RepID=UPI0009BFC9FA|nr:alpha/beta hydrolase [Burkholderia cepacia]
MLRGCLHVVFITACFYVASAHGRDIQSCADRFAVYRNAHIATGVPEKHLPRLLLADPVPSDKTVVLIHGLYESPYFLKGSARRFSDAGYNVISVLLAGHWDRDWTRIDTVSYPDWIDDAELGMSIARCFGSQVVVAGHSLGGTLALYAALAHPRDVSALVLWAPATELAPLPTLGGLLGRLTGLYANRFMDSPPDGDESAKISGNPVVELYELIQVVGHRFGDSLPVEPHGMKRDMRLSYVNVGEHVTAPTLSIVPERDPAINSDETIRLMHQIPASTQSILYPHDSMVWHANVTKSAIDAYASSPGDYNHSFDWMMDQVIAFADQAVSANRTSLVPEN